MQIPERPNRYLSPFGIKTPKREKSMLTSQRLVREVVVAPEARTAARGDFFFTFICSGFGVSREEARERDEDEREDDARDEDAVERDEDGVARGTHWLAGGGGGAASAAVRSEPPFAMWFITNWSMCPGTPQDASRPATLLSVGAGPGPSQRLKSSS